MKRKKKVTAVDLFCGAGGTSTGLALACKKIKAKDVRLTAINHWTVAVQSHKKNHPWANHLCESVERIDPRKAVPSGRLNILVASPECTNHSIARGGRPINDQSRATAWHVLKWAQELYIDNILIENVREFAQWGPLGADGKPLKKKKGETYRAFIEALRSLGYRVEDRVLNAADYGDATTRERLFIIARRPAHKRIQWPEPSHAKDAANGDLFRKLKPWRPAKEIIDWQIPGQSIFGRKKPLASATIERIAAGIEKFGGDAAQPFLIVLQNHGKARSIEEPLSTITAQGNKFGVCEPYVVPVNGGHKENRKHNGTALPPFVLQQQSGGAPRSTKKPLPTVASKGAIGLVQPIIVTPGGPNLRKGRSVEKPLPTVTCKDRMALVQPFIVPFYGERRGQTPRTHSVEKPLPAPTSHGAGGLVQPFIIPVNHGKKDKRSHSVEEPMRTITGVDAWGLIAPHLIKYYGTARNGAKSVEMPVETITAKDRFGLVTPVLGKKGKNGRAAYAIDILFRMLQPHELAAAMGFPSTYKFTGSREDQVKQIGNAVAVQTAKALCLALLEG